MLVYGDHQRLADAGAETAAIGEALSAYRKSPGGPTGHAQLIAAFIRLGELAQGIADSERGTAGIDDDTPRQRLGAGLLSSLAAAIGQSWQTRFAPVDIPRLDMAMLGTAGQVALRKPEGYAHYAVYPEAYFLAARRSGLGPDTAVIGIRSIGTGLAAMVAAGLGAAPAFSVRPVGHPFDRHVALSRKLAAAILERAGAFAIVDEGPGKSGSSFACVADWLATEGVPRQRIHFFPGHGGELGEAAMPSRREHWRRAPRHHVGLGELGLPERLSQALSVLVGPLDAPLDDISGGAWRAGGDPPDQLPPADRQMEKLKYRATAGGRRWLVKFAGLGMYGETKLRQGRLLAAEGFVPAPLVLVHGFLVEPWIEGRFLDRLRPAALQQVGTYIGRRARLLPSVGRGASLRELAEMAATNIAERLGPGLRPTVDERLASAQSLDGLVRPVHNDSRLHAWEWVVRADGTLVKTDALDHAEGHDLVGCQDVSWDVAGAVTEFELAGPEEAELAAKVAAISGEKIDPRLLAVMRLCYLGFQIGLWTDAAGRADEAERARIGRVLDRYDRQVRRVLNLSAPAGTRAAAPPVPPARPIAGTGVAPPRAASR